MGIEDIGKFAPGSFDTILLMMNNFGLLQSFEKAQKLLRKIHRISSADAIIIASSNDPYATKNMDHIRYHEYNKQRGRMGGQLRLRVRFGKYATDWFDYLIVSKKEMKAILKDTGWEAKRFIDSETSGQYMALITRKPCVLC